MAFSYGSLQEEKFSNEPLFPQVKELDSCAILWSTNDWFSQEDFQR